MEVKNTRRVNSAKNSAKVIAQSNKIAGSSNQVVALQVGEAWRKLEAGGILTGQAEKVSARIDHGLLAAAGRKVGSENTTNIVLAALAAFVASDPFVEWFLSDKDRLPADFELGI